MVEDKGCEIYRTIFGEGIVSVQLHPAKITTNPCFRSRKSLARLPLIDDIYEASSLSGSIAVRNMQSAGDGLSKANLFSQMLAESDSQEKTNLSILSVQAETSNLIVAGLDITAVTLTYLVYAVLN
ncbi:uncharacterized protein FTOL_00750 [Fusarium torulosum]|uniref:Uncharacterized protein n=1 Tax=Fusarium torulosum TaxID=33205 RepID=A0AAE8LYN6_9HYPO|nr:uncharacterized protein FTOL_00750 [Fusarium torulosum]